MRVEMLVFSPAQRREVTAPHYIVFRRQCLGAFPVKEAQYLPTPSPQL